MSKIILKKNGIDYLFGLIPLHYPADRVYLDGDTTKNVQDKVARKADLTNLDLTGTTNTTGSTIASGTYFYLNGTLVRAKTAIASGATFTLNTNYEVMTVGDALDGLTSKFLLISHSETSDTPIGANSVVDFIVTSEIPSGYYPISVTLERGTSAINAIGCLGIVNTAQSSDTPTWRVKVLNYSTISSNIRPIFRITCMKM